MFELLDERELILEENERKPNRYTARALLIGFFVMLVILLLNEMDVFHVNKGILRSCSVVTMVFTLLPQVLVRREPFASSPRCKYVLLVCVMLLTFTLTLALFLFATPLYFLPLLLSVQYNSRRFCTIALVCACLCILVTPLFGWWLGLWNVAFLNYLLSSALHARVEAIALAPLPALINMAGILGYISFPWLLIVLMFSRFALSATSKGAQNLQNQLRILRMSRMDALTGLYNQNAYTNLLNSQNPECPVGVLFFDVDGLKRVNDNHSHERGDLLLRRCAESLTPLFDSNCCGYRVGGDEFVVLMQNADEKTLRAKLEAWRRSIERINQENVKLHDGLFCHMSVGSAFGSSNDLLSLLHTADERMYQAKEKYHRQLQA